MRVLIERNIPFIHGLLESYASVEYLAADEFCPAVVRHADALIVRTRTRCDAALLDGSDVKFIASATIGTDHIDLQWCRAHGIAVYNAPGCNAPAVAQYVLSAILHLANRDICQYTIGVIGVGHVGSIVQQWAMQLGMPTLVNDPPRQRREGGDVWSSLDVIAQRADVITVHTPLDASTLHLIDREFVSKLRRAPIVINAARGPVVDTGAMLDALDAGLVHHAVIDCWEHEPDISGRLLDAASIATPHIAGYSYEGKARATRMVLDALARHFCLPHIPMDVAVPAGACSSVSANAIAGSYDPLVDSAALKADPCRFEALRNHYALRHEVR